MWKKIDLTGLRNGRLTVLREGPRDKFNHTRWYCRCDCGKEMLAWGHRLRTPGDLSCGCWIKEKTSVRAGKHYMRNTPEYQAWRSMKDRCTNPKGRNYKNYGARGIKVCQEWLDSFEAFFAHVGYRPSSGHSLGRIDNDGHYEPENVRWEVDEQQKNNMRGNRIVVYRGQSMTAAQAIRAAGSIVKRDTFGKRLAAGWSVEQAAEIPPDVRNRI